MPNEIQFVKEIEKRECLYNYNLQEYNLRDVVESAWAEVARISELSVSDCKEKWRNIRSSFVRSMKKSLKPKKPYYLSPHLQFVLPFTKHNRTENADGSQKNDYQMSEEHDARTETALTKSECDTDVEENQFESINVDPDIDISSSEEDFLRNISNKTVRRRRKRPTSLHDESRYILEAKQLATTSLVSNYSKQLNNSSMRYFLLSLLPDFESMTEKQIRTFKVRVMMLIDDIKTNSEKEVGQSSFEKTDKLERRLKRNLKKNT